METVQDMARIYAAIKMTDNQLAIFDDAAMYLPDEIKAEQLFFTIIVKFGTCPVTVSETSQFKAISDLFFVTHREDIERIASALNAEYKPLENYDRYEDGTDTNKGSRTNAGTSANKTIADNSQHDSGTDRVNGGTGGTDTTTRQVSAFNQGADFSNDYRDQTQYGGTNNQTTTYGKLTQYGIDQTDTRTDNLTQTDDFTNEHKWHIHGNIGVTTSQRMLESEIALRLKYNPYDLIAAKWADYCTLGCW